MATSDAHYRTSSRPNTMKRPQIRNGYLSTSSSSTSTGGTPSVSRNISLMSVPSLFQALESGPRASRSGSQLAFTTEELQLPDAVGVVVTPPGTKNKKKKFVKRGQMTAGPNNDANLGSQTDSKTKVLPPGTPTNISALTLNTNIGGMQLRARPTVTTILRQQHVLEKAEKKEKDKVDSLMLSNCSLLDTDSAAKQQKFMEEEETKAAEAKRLLQAKLAYERAIAASRKIADEKQKIADEMRQKEKEWQAVMEEQREAEREKRRAKAEQLQKTTSGSKRAMDAVVRFKQLKAELVKKELEQLHAEAKVKQEQEELKKQDKIQQIQAAKIALKRTKETMGNPNQFYRSIAIPETQIKLRLQKEEEKRKLQEARQKIQAEKQIKSVKLIRAMKKIQNFERQAQEQQQSKQKPLRFNSKLRGFSLSAITKDINNNSISGSTSSIVASVGLKGALKNGEIEEMLEELKRLKVENLNLKGNVQQQSRSTGASYKGSSVKILGAKNLPPPSSSVTTHSHNSFFNDHQRLQSFTQSNSPKFGQLTYA